MATTTDFPGSYMRLRTLLDALVVNTLRYCLDGEDPLVCISRMEGIEGELVSMINRVNGEAPCDPGYFNCGGVCVPYACLESFTQKAAE
jgi:hypothetical protein